MGFEIRKVLDVNYIPAGDNTATVNIEPLDEKARKTLKYLLLTYFDKSPDKILDVSEQKEFARVAGKKITKDKLNELLFIFQVPVGAEREVLTDILPLIKTRVGAEKRTANDIAYIRKVILPAFVTLHENWNEGYEFLIKKMKGQFNVVIAKYDCAELHLDADGIIREERALGLATPKPNDKCVITMNAYDKTNISFLRETAYHEIMHAVSMLAIKDKGKSECRLSHYFDTIKYSGKLTRLAKRYMKNQEDAMAYAGRDLLGPRKKLSKEEKEEFYERYKEIRSKFGCWANRRKKNDTAFSQFLGLCWIEVSNSEELLAQGLSFYYGSKAQRKILRQYEPWLYGLIENEINGKLNGFINKSYSYKQPNPPQLMMPPEEEKGFEISSVLLPSTKFIPSGDGKTKIDIRKLNKDQRKELVKILKNCFDSDGNTKLSEEEQKDLKEYVYLEITPKKLKQLKMVFQDLTIDQDEAVLKLINKLKNNDPEKRAGAVADLMEAYQGAWLTTKRKQIVAALLKILKHDPEPNVRIIAAQWSSMGIKAVKAALPHLIGRLESEKNADVRAAIVEDFHALYLMNQDPAIQAKIVHGLIMAESDKEHKVRKKAKEVWGQIMNN